MGNRNLITEFLDKFFTDLESGNEPPLRRSCGCFKLNNWFLSIGIGFLLCFTGCVVGPDFNRPLPPELSQQFVNQTVENQPFTGGPSVDLTTWWRQFSDPLLEHLLERAVSQNPTIQESYHRIAAARAQVKIQGGRLNPTANLGGNYALTKRSQNAQPFVGRNGESFNLFTLGSDTVWEFDLFGKIQRSIESAEANVQFEQFELEAVRQTLLADIASSYLRIRLLQRQIESTNESLAIQSQTEQLVAGRADAGLSTELDQSQTEAFFHRSLALRAVFEQQLEVEFNLLNLFLGQTPDPQLKTFLGVLPLPQIPAVPEIGFPAELLRRRPDIRRDEMAVAAATANVGIATADLYPQLSLLGSISVSAQTVSGLFETEGLGFSVGPSVSWNILNYKRIGFNIEAQEALFRQTAARYQSTVLGAVNEVEEALIQHHGYKKQWFSLNEAIVADKKAVELSLERYKAGKANFQRVIDAQQQLLQDRQLRDEAQSLAIDALIRLYKATGGGWQVGQPAQQLACAPSMSGGQCLQPAMAHPDSPPVMYHRDPVHDPVPYDPNQSDFQQLPGANQDFQSPPPVVDPENGPVDQMDPSELEDFEFLHPAEEETEFLFPETGATDQPMYEATSLKGFKPLKRPQQAATNGPANLQTASYEQPIMTQQPMNAQASQASTQPSPLAPQMAQPQMVPRPMPMPGRQAMSPSRGGIQRYPLLDALQQ